MSRLKRRAPFAAALLAFTLAGCVVEGEKTPAAEEPKIDLAAEEQAIRGVNAKWLELQRARDAAGIGALFVEDGWTLSGTEGLQDGRAAIVAKAQEGFEKNPDALVDWGSKQVWVSASGDLAVERGWWTTDDDGEGEGEGVNGEYLTVFSRVGGEWKILADAAIPLEGADADAD